MINNFLGDDGQPDDYHSSHQAYTHPTFGTHLFLGDMQAALDIPGLHRLKIATCTPPHKQS